ncbi:MAG: TolC family protein [Deltaproteobacteria bacterium]|nr:MAG: TolC family protein [Deltaproteobacteria bacterium]
MSVPRQPGKLTKHPLLIIVLLCAALSGTAGAVSAEALQLTLGEAVRMAQQRNPDASLARNGEESAQVALQRARGAFLPDLEASGAATEQYEHGDSADYATTSLKTRATLNLFNGFADSAALAASQLQLSASSAELKRQLQTTAFEAATRFIAVLTSKELVLVEKENLENQQLLLEQIGAWYQAGSRSLTDLYRQQAETAQAELDLLQARRNLEVARVELLQTLALPPSTELVVLPAEFEGMNALQDPDLEQLYQQALQSRPDLQAKALQVEVAGEGIREAKSGYLPRLDLFAEAGSSYSGLNDGRSFNDQFTDDNLGTAVGLTLNIPLFDRDQTRTSVAQARIEQADASAEQARLRYQVGVEIGQALADYQTAQKQAEVTLTQLKAARQALAAAEERYAVGASTWTDLSDTRTAFVLASSNEINARYQVLQQRLALAFYRGDIEQVLSNTLQPEKQS